MMKRSPMVKPRWSPSSISRSWNCYQSTWNVSRGISVKPLWVKSMDSWGYFMGFHGELMRISPSTDGDIPWIFGHQIWADDNSPGWQVAPTDNGDMEACPSRFKIFSDWMNHPLQHINENWGCHLWFSEFFLRGYELKRAAGWTYSSAQKCWG